MARPTAGRSCGVLFGAAARRAVALATPASVPRSAPFRASHTEMGRPRGVRRAPRSCKHCFPAELTSMFAQFHEFFTNYQRWIAISYISLEIRAFQSDPYQNVLRQP